MGTRQASFRDPIRKARIVHCDKFAHASERHPRMSLFWRNSSFRRAPGVLRSPDAV
jgi:hypothetical protein